MSEGSVTIPTGSEKHSTPQNSSKPQNKVWVERYSCLFPSVLNSPKASTDKRTQQMKGVRRKGVRYKPQNLPGLPTIHRYQK